MKLSTILLAYCWLIVGAYQLTTTAPPTSPPYKITKKSPKPSPYSLDLEDLDLDEVR